MTTLHTLAGTVAGDDGSLPAAAPSLGVTPPLARWVATDMAHLPATATNIMEWPDLTRVYPFAALSSSNRPIAQYSGADRVIRFTGTVSAATATPDWRTLWIVLRWGAAAGSVINIGESNNGDLTVVRRTDNQVEVQGIGAASVSAPCDSVATRFQTIMVVNAPGQPLAISCNGAAPVTGDVPGGTPTYLTLGRVGETFGAFFVAEAAVWPTMLTAADAATLHAGAVARYPSQTFGAPV